MDPIAICRAQCFDLSLTLAVRPEDAMLFWKLACIMQMWGFVAEECLN